MFVDSENPREYRKQGVKGIGFKANYKFWDPSASPLLIPLKPPVDNIKYTEGYFYEKIFCSSDYKFPVWLIHENPERKGLRPPCFLFQGFPFASRATFPFPPTTSKQNRGVGTHLIWLQCECSRWSRKYIIAFQSTSIFRDLTLNESIVPLTVAVAATHDDMLNISPKCIEVIGEDTTGFNYTFVVYALSAGKTEIAANSSADLAG